MERASSIYGSSSALRGVQLKIGEKFKPPAKVTLPVGWRTRDPSRFLNFAYDFTLEEEVIAKVKAEREAREQHEQVQKLKELEIKTATVNPVVANMGGNILQPTTATAILQPTTATTTANSVNASNEDKPFNYKDFEDNTDTPFEAVELQCINNMEALKSVLQPNVEADTVVSSQSQIPKGNSEVGGIPISGMPRRTNPFIQQAPSHSPEASFPINGSPMQVTGSPPYPPMFQDNHLHTQIEQNQPHDTNPFTAGTSSNGINSLSHQSNTASYSLPTTTVSDTGRAISLPGAMRVLPVAPTQPPPRRPASVPNENLTSEMLAFSSQVESPTPGKKRPVPKPRKLAPLRNGPEVSPTPEPLYDVPLYNVPPPLPPKMSIGKNNQKPDLSREDSNLKRFPTPLPPISPPPKTEQTHSPVNDPGLTMTADERQFVDQISAMGFPVARTARAVKNLGCKEPEVIEFLISVNEVCSKGYPESQVEMVLKDNNDQTKALEYLKLMVQFKDFGFQDEKLFEALKKSECDSNKALDILTCAG